MARPSDGQIWLHFTGSKITKPSAGYNWLQSTGSINGPTLCWVDMAPICREQNLSWVNLAPIYMESNPDTQLTIWEQTLSQLYLVSFYREQNGQGLIWVDLATSYEEAKQPCTLCWVEPSNLQEAAQPGPQLGFQFQSTGSRMVRPAAEQIWLYYLEQNGQTLS